MDAPPTSRRAFLYRAGGAGLALTAAACGATQSHRAAPTASVAPRPPQPRSSAPRTLAEAMRGPVIARNRPGFADAAPVYNERFDAVRPQAVARPLDAQDVRGAVRWAVAHDVPLVARSDGHSYAGYSTVADGVVLDLRMMGSIHVDHGAGTATIEAGAQLVDVYSALAAHGATLPAGSCPSVGIAGHALGGGVGLAGRAFGLTTDNLLAVALVSADGTARVVDRGSDPDLLWALRGGGGGNFGVATALTFKLHRAPARAAWFIVSFPWSSAGDAVATWQAWAPHARDEVTSILHLDAGAGTTAVSVSGQYLGRAGDLDRLLGPLRAVLGARVAGGEQAYFPLQLRWAGCLGQSLASCHTAGTRPGGVLQRASFAAKSDYVARALTAPARSALVRAVEERARHPGSGAIPFDSYGGAINRIAPGETAFAHRDALYCIQYLSYDGDASWLARTHAAMRPYVSGYAYQNYIDPDLREWRDAYYGANYERLVNVQRRVDPEHHFRFAQAIGS